MRWRWMPGDGCKTPSADGRVYARRRLRCVGEPDRRFQEDALRIMRGLRFSAALGFSLEEETGESIHRNRWLLRAIAPERIQAELWKLLCGADAPEVLRGYPDVIGVFWPEVSDMVGFDQKNHHHCYDVWEHTLHALAAVPPDRALRCAALLHDVGKPRTFLLDADGCGHFYGHQAVGRDMADEMLRRLRCSNAFREQVVRLVAWHDRDIPREDRAIRRALGKLGEEDLRRLLELKRADNLAQAPAYWGRQTEDPAGGGDPGPAAGREGLRLSGGLGGEWAGCAGLGPFGACGRGASADAAGTGGGRDAAQ